MFFHGLCGDGGGRYYLNLRRKNRNEDQKEIFQGIIRRFLRLTQ